MSYGQCIECGNDLVAHHGVDGLSIRCGHGERIAELEAEVARLTEEREAWKEDAVAWVPHIEAVERERDRQREDIRRLLAALEKYGTHTLDENHLACSSLLWFLEGKSGPCSCGFVALLADMRERMEVK